MNILRSESEHSKATGKTPAGQDQFQAEEQTRNIGMCISPCDRVAVERL
jgi:hypothetical protein